MLSKDNTGKYLSKKFYKERNRLLQDMEDMTDEECWRYEMDDMWKHKINKDDFLMEYDISDGEGGTKTKKIDIRDLPGFS